MKIQTLSDKQGLHLFIITIAGHGKNSLASVPHGINDSTGNAFTAEMGQIS